MSKLEVTVQKVSDVKPHPNADRLELATVLGWQVVVGKGSMQPGDLVVYFPIDSVLPDALVEKLFADSKIKPEGGRIRTIKIRGAISQGLAVPCSTINLLFSLREVGEDVTDVLRVKKYEPPETKIPRYGVRTASSKETNAHFFRYTDIDHLKKFPKMLEGKRVVVTEKLHGTNFRAGWVKKNGRGMPWWEKLLVALGLVNDEEFVWGSHNVQLQSRTTGADVYTEQVVMNNLKKKIPYGTVIYGEIIGYGIQTGYTYGLDRGERMLVMFDVRVGDKYLGFDEMRQLAWTLDLPIPPVLWVGEFSMEEMEYHAEGFTSLPNDDVREGIVVRPMKEEAGYNGRQIYKLLNPEYLLNKNNSEAH